MEISLREWLVIGGVVIIALIIFDGWRRVRGGRNSLRMDIDRKARELPEDDVAPSNNPELPYGGARPVGAQPQAYVPPPRRQAAVAPHTAPKAKSHSPAVAPTRIEPTFGNEGVDAKPGTVEPVAPAAEPAVAQAASTQPPMPQRRPEPEPSRSEPVQNIPTEPAFSLRPDAGSPFADPLFDEPSDDDYPPRGFGRAEQAAEIPPRSEAPAPDTAATRAEAPRPESFGMGETDPLFDDLPPAPSLDLEKPVPLLMERNRQPRRQAAPASMTASDAEPAAPTAVPAPANPPAPKAESVAPQHAQKASSASAQKPAQKTAQKAAQKAAAKAEQQDLLFAAEPAEPASDTGQPDAEHVLMITAVSSVGEGFPGALLYKILSACDLHFGDMDIFHRHEEGSDSGPVQFSMANAVNPGTFDLDTIEQLSTPAVTFFMSMDEPQDVMNAFECMLATAETVARHLDGDLLDENHSVLRPQTKEHYRQRIRDFEMHNRSRRGGGSRG